MESTTAYTSFEEVRAAGDGTREIAHMCYKARTGSPAGSKSLGLLPSHRLLEPGLGRALDFARPGGFRRQFLATSAGQEPVLSFYSSFAAAALSPTTLDEDGWDAATAEASPERAPPQTKTSGATHTVLAILKSFVGSGVLFLPKAYDNGGLLLSNVFSPTLSSSDPPRSARYTHAVHLPSVHC